MHPREKNGKEKNHNAQSEKNVYVIETIWK